MNILKITESIQSKYKYVYNKYKSMYINIKLVKMF